MNKIAPKINKMAPIQNVIVSSLFCNFDTKILDESFANCSGKWSRKKAAVLLDFVNHGQKYFVGDITF